MLVFSFFSFAACLLLLSIIGLPMLRARRPDVVPEAETQQRPVSRLLRVSSALYLVLVPVGVLAIYMNIGAPSMLAPQAVATRPPMSAEAIAAMPDSDRRAMIEDMVAGLSARLAQQPDDADGWRMLARSQAVLGRQEESAQSYRTLFGLEAGSEEDWRNYANVLASLAPEGMFPTSDEFIAALSEIEKRAPGDPFALFFRGGAARDSGEIESAIQLWTALLQQMPQEAPARATLAALIEEAQSLAETKP